MSKNTERTWSECDRLEALRKSLLKLWILVVACAFLMVAMITLFNATTGVPMSGVTPNGVSVLLYYDGDTQKTVACIEHPNDEMGEYQGSIAISEFCTPVRFLDWAVFADRKYAFVFRHYYSAQWYPSLPAREAPWFQQFSANDSGSALSLLFRSIIGENITYTSTPPDIVRRSLHDGILTETTYSARNISLVVSASAVVLNLFCVFRTAIIAIIILIEKSRASKGLCPYCAYQVGVRTIVKCSECGTTILRPISAGAKKLIAGSMPPSGTNDEGHQPWEPR